MIITCSNCETKFNLPESKIPAGGAKVKCSKCGNIFKVTPPAQEPEDEVASLLQDEQGAGEQTPPEPEPKPEPAPKPAPKPEPKPAPKPEPVPEPELEESSAEDDLFSEAEEELGNELDDDLFGDTGDSGGSDDFEDDLFGSADNSKDAEIGADLFEDEDSFGEAAPDSSEDEFDIDDELFGDSEPESAPVAESDVDEDPFSDDDLFSEDDNESFSEDDLFGDDEIEEDLVDDSVENDVDFEDDGDLEEEDFDEDDGLSLDDGEIAGFDLDDSLDAPAKKTGKKKGKGLLIFLILILLFGGGAGAAWYLKLWDKLPFSVPFVTSDDAGVSDQELPPSMRFSKFSFKDLRQFYVNNDKAGQLFIIEGKVVNNFNKPKELIEVEAQLFDDKGQVLDSKRLLCGNTLSLFQLEVQSRQEIEAGLASKVGVLSNNTLLQQGMDTPFMVVFFKPSPAVKEYVINVVEAKEPPKK